MPVNVSSITMINCRYCNSPMIPREVSFGGFNRTIISCKNHKPAKVAYKHIEVGSFEGDNWVISYGDYRLSYYVPMNRTLFQLRHPEATSASQYYELIKKFDSELEIAPEQFPNKIKTLLAWS